MREELEKSFAVLAGNPFWEEYEKRIDAKIKDALLALTIEKDMNQICRLQGKVQAYRMVKEMPGAMLSRGTENNPDKG